MVKSASRPSYCRRSLLLPISVDHYQYSHFGYVLTPNQASTLLMENLDKLYFKHQISNVPKLDFDGR